MPALPVMATLLEEVTVTRAALCMPDPQAEEKAQAFLKDCMEQKDSAGGIVTCTVTGMPRGIGEPVFDKLDALLGQAIFSIGAVKGVEIGDGFAAARARGSENNDQYGQASGKLTNHAGGILGGMSDGSTVIVRAAFKPTPSIARTQQALHADGQVRDLEIHGRHDPVIAPRAAVVVECMTAITVLDLLMRDMPARMDRLHEYMKQKQAGSSH